MSMLALRGLVKQQNASIRRTLSGSVNVHEVGKFDVVGQAWWDATSAAGTGPLHAMNPVRVSFIRESVASQLARQASPVYVQLKGLKVLDVGCGGGILSEALARLGAAVTSIDPSPRNIAVASSHSKHDPLTSGIQYKCTTVEEIAASGEKFDVVCTLEVVEHVEMPMSFLAACSSCLNEGGSLFVSTINRTYKSHLISILGAEYLNRLVPIGTHDWHKFITPEELGLMIGTKGSNMRIRNTQGIILTGINPFNGKMEWRLSSSDLDNNYIIHAVKVAPPQSS